MVQYYYSILNNVRKVSRLLFFTELLFVLLMTTVVIQTGTFRMLGYPYGI
jgi:hypothetical protein